MRVRELLRKFLVELPRPVKQAMMITADAFAYMFCAFAAAWLLVGQQLSMSTGFLVGLFAVAVAIPLGWQQGLYQSVVRYIGTEFVFRANVTAAGSAVAVAGLTYLVGMQYAPFRWAAVFWALSLIYICSSRYLARTFLAPSQSRRHREHVIIYGAGAGGAQLAAGLQATGAFLPVAIVDDDISLHGRRVRGIKVAPPSDIERIIQDHGVTRVLLAMPSASRRRRRRVLEQLASLTVRVQTIPDIRDLVSGQARVDDIREVAVGDLLGRSAVPPDPRLLRACIEGKSVMVTGAGGSIGSELCREIVKLGARKLVLFDICEATLYLIEKVLHKYIESKSIDCEIITLLGSVCDQNRVADVIRTFDVQTIYHAAAYKHVPVVEQNLLEGVRNNALGTFQMAKAACNSSVETFVLVSTDKAVGPTSVMGATKRVAELVLQAMQEEFSGVRFCMVRFGNVLESSGSVVPLFREQIRYGGPVTVTHRDIIRYFMTIQEAAELVIGAGSMATGGDVFVLDMGKPVRIQDLARRMINLAGLTVRDDDNPDGDIEIVYTGLRPAEKLYEELLIGNDVSGTDHPRIMRAIESFIPYSELQTLMQQLSAALDSQDCDRVREILIDAVSGYNPTNGIDDLAWAAKNGAAKQPVADNVSDIASHRAGA